MKIIASIYRKIELKDIATACGLCCAMLVVVGALLLREVIAFKKAYQDTNRGLIAVSIENSEHKPIPVRIQTGTKEIKPYPGGFGYMSTWVPDYELPIPVRAAEKEK